MEYLCCGAFLFGFISAIAAKNKGLDWIPWCLAGFLLGPFGLIWVLVTKPDVTKRDTAEVASGYSKKCPYCAELIKPEAIKCRFCGSDLPDPVHYPL